MTTDTPRGHRTPRGLGHRTPRWVLGRLRIDPPLPLYPVLISRRPVAPVLVALARERVLAQQDATQDLIVSHRMAERHQPMLRDLAGEVRDGPLVVEVILLFSRF